MLLLVGREGFEPSTPSLSEKCSNQLSYRPRRDKNILSYVSIIMSLMRTRPHVITIGGGTGTFVVLSGLKDYPVELSAIVTMTDSGGSTGKLRDQLGVLPPGDLRQALVALSESEEIWRKLFTYRFDSGDFDGHSFGNLLISALEKITGSNQEAVNYAMRILQTKGQVIPVTFSNCSLCAKYQDGAVVKGESNIEEYKFPKSPISHVYLSPKALMNLEAKHTLERADYIIFGPGDLYTSILPNILVEGMSTVLANTTAKKIFVVNLMTRTGQTDNFKVSDFVNELSKYMGEEYLDYILINNAKHNPKLLKIYKEVDNAIPVEDDILGNSYKKAKVIRTDLLSSERYAQSSSDQVKRSLIRHDPVKLANAILDIIDSRF